MQISPNYSNIINSNVDQYGNEYHYEGNENDYIEKGNSGDQFYQERVEKIQEIQKNIQKSPLIPVKEEIKCDDHSSKLNSKVFLIKVIVLQQGSALPVSHSYVTLV